MRKLLFIAAWVTLGLSVSQWIAAVTFEPHYFPYDFKKPPERRMFEGRFQNLQTLQSFQDYMDSLANAKNIAVEDSPDFVNELDTLIRKRFFHAYAAYEWKDNYIINLLGRFAWNHLHGTVIPEDIVKRNDAMCSQQAIVFMELLKERGYQVRKAALNNHFCSEVFYKGKWHLYDTNNEIYFKDPYNIPSLSDLVENKGEYPAQELYPKKAPDEAINLLNIDRAEVGKTNDFPAKNARILHQTTYLLSHTLWLFLFLIWYITKPQVVKSSKQKAVQTYQTQKILIQNKFLEKVNSRP